MHAATDDYFTCMWCAADTEHLFICDGCGETFCADHYDPDAHYCNQPVLTLTLSNGSRYDIPISGWRRRLIANARSSGRFSGTLVSMVLASPVTLALFLLLWVWFPLQFGVLFSIGVDHIDQWAKYFVLDSQHIWYVWTWVTSILSHGGLAHLAVNSLVLAMFGPFVERSLGPRRYLGLFVVGGIVSGLLQVSVAAVVGDPIQVVGASGAIAAILGLHSTVEPDVEVRLFFVIPLQMWMATALLLVGSVAAVVVGGIGAFGVAHLAHAGGAAIGVAYGLYRDTTPLVSHLAHVSRTVQARFNG